MLKAQLVDKELGVIQDTQDLREQLVAGVHLELLVSWEHLVTRDHVETLDSQDQWDLMEPLVHLVSRVSLVPAVQLVARVPLEQVEPRVRAVISVTAEVLVHEVFQEVQE